MEFIHRIDSKRGVAAGVCERSNLSKVAKKVKGTEWVGEG